MFETKQKVLFKHCDPAGIVFFPRYYEIINDCVEAFFDKALAWPFEEFLPASGVPTANMNTDFKAPSRHGDILDLKLVVTRLGRASMTYEMIGTCDGELRFKTVATIVHVNAEGRPTPWPDRIRAQIDQLGGERS